MYVNIWSMLIFDNLTKNNLAAYSMLYGNLPSKEYIKITEI